MKKRILNEILDIEICLKIFEDYKILKKIFFEKNIKIDAFYRIMPRR